MATIKENLLSNTDKVTEATELLKVLGDREGQYVWKKMQKYELSVSAAGTRTTYTLTSPVKIDSMVGITADYPTGESFKIIDGSKFNYNGTTYSYTISSQTDYSVIFYTLGKVGASATLLNVKTLDFDYAVADAENSYPNGGELDGYWYDRLDVAEEVSF